MSSLEDSTDNNPEPECNNESERTNTSESYYTTNQFGAFAKHRNTTEIPMVISINASKNHVRFVANLNSFHKKIA